MPTVATTSARGRGRPPKKGTSKKAASDEPPGPTVNLTPGLTQLFSFMFKMPSVLGYGRHWELTPLEASQLGSAWNDACAGMPRKWFKQIDDLLSKYAPIAGAVAATYIITKPRVEKTKVLIAEAKAEMEAAHDNGGSTSPDAADRPN
jgi:hypothetical protein